MNLKPKLLNAIEDTSVMLVMLFVLLPVRLVFVRFVTDEWIGSFGIVTLVMVSIVLLSKYNKLGLFGRMFWRTSTRFRKGKKRFISYFVLGFTIYMWAAVIIGIQYAEDNQDLMDAKRELLINMTPEDQAMYDKVNAAADAGDIVTVNNALRDQLDNISIELMIMAAIGLFLMPFIDFESWALIISFTNDFTAGWILHFATIVIVESFEIIGLMIYVHLVTKPKPAMPKS